MNPYQFLIQLTLLTTTLSELHNKVALSHITLLLPYSSDYIHSPTQFKITSHGGQSNDCVEWSVEPKQGIVDVTPTESQHYMSKNDKCPPNTFNQLIIKAISPPSNGRVSATITAIDPKTQYSAECEVFIDKVDTLQVATSTRLIYLWKYEAIAVNGFDDKGNKFSTLQGLPMTWTGIGTHLEVVDYSEASLMLPNTLNAFQFQKNKNPLPVKGRRTGQEDVQVTIDINPNSAGFAHKGCKKASASLFVVMDLKLVPRTLYAAKCCVAHFNLVTTSNNSVSVKYMDYELHRQMINLPNTQYQFVLAANGMHTRKLKMSIAQNGQLTTTNIIESGKLLVEDKVTSQKNFVENRADARVYVVDAYSIYAEIVKFKQNRVRPNTYMQRKERSDTPWYLTVNEAYIVRLTLFDKVGNAICVRDIHTRQLNKMDLKSWKMKYICSMIDWSVTIINHKQSNQELERFEEKEFAVINDKKDNEFKIKPSKIAKFTLKFSAVGMKCRKPQILAESMKKVVITSPVFFQNSSTVYCANCEQKHARQKLVALIPYTGHHNIHKIPVFVDGGSGRYRLEINDSNIANILGHDIQIGTDQKVAVIHGNAIGHTYLFVIDYFNPDNFAYIDVEIELVKRWEINANVVKEIMINNFVEMSVMIRDQYNRRFGSLDGMKQVITTSSQQQMVSVEFVAPSINQLIEQQFGAKKNKENNTQIIKNALKTQILNNLGNKDKTGKKPINCRDMDGKVIVRGIGVGYDSFNIRLQNKDVNSEEMDSSMFVSVYQEIKPLHKAVAIGININEPYTMHWEYGPLPWPIKEVIPVDEQFLHPLQVNIPPVNDGNFVENNDKDFGFRYNGKTLEFICYKQFHAMVELTVSNRLQLESLPFPVLSVVEIEVFCLPQFKFNSSKMEMGVGTRKNARVFYPNWVKTLNISKEFFIEIDQISDNEEKVVSVVNNDNLIAKRLGSSLIMGTLRHTTQRVYIHASGFKDKLEIIVLFKDFTMEMASYWIINGNEQIAHIEGLDENHHILPFRHNFDDVFVEWVSEDANIIELLPIVPRPNPQTNDIKSSKEERNNIGTGLSVKLIAHSVGLVNIKAIIKLRNPPKKIKSTFQLTQTVTVIPSVINPCNSIILKPNSSLLLSPIFNPDTNVAGIGQIYTIDHTYSNMNGYVYVSDKKLNIRNDAPISENIAVTLILKSPKFQRNKPYKTKEYPLTQAASLIVSIVQPTGLNLLNAHIINEESVLYSQSVDYGGIGIETDSNQPFWSSLTSNRETNPNNNAFVSNKYGKTENILCVNQNITLKIAILDELARELNVIDQCKVVSNDTSIVLPHKDIRISTESIGGAMYANVVLYALQSGYATITFREKDASNVYTKSESQSPQSDNTNYYVYDDPKFLRTFLTIHVLANEECQKEFGIVYSNNGNINELSNETMTVKSMHKTQTTNKGKNTYKNGKQWQAMKGGSIASLPRSNKALIGIVCVVVFVLIIGCTWGNCSDMFGFGNINNGMMGNEGQSVNNTMQAIAYDQRQSVPPSAFNPYAQTGLDTSNNNSMFQQSSFNTSNSFYM